MASAGFAKQFGFRPSSAHGLANRLPEESRKKVKNRLFVNLVEFRRFSRRNGRDINSRAKRSSPG